VKVTEHLKQAKATLFSIEILPPLKGKGIQSIFDCIDPLMEFKPSFIDVTYHREEYLYKKREGGYLEKISIRKRPGTVAICAAVMNRYKVDAIPHMICGGFTREETENALIDLHFLGIDNVLALRGDSIKTESSFIPEPNGHPYAVDLIKQITDMNAGKFLVDDLQDVEPTNFCIGVAGYPEKHFEAPNMATDLKYLKQKIEAGSEYVVTQMFFDNKNYYDFVKKCNEAGINIPVIPGIKILTTKKQLTILPKIFHIDIPEELYNEAIKCKTDADVKQVGIEWAIAQSKDLIKHKVPCVHLYTMGNPDNTRRVAEGAF
jgi:methylenetetrahydrofolate reductase (NADPH)